MKITAITLCLILSGCATIRRHPVASAIVVGVSVGATVALTHRGCPYVENGEHYNECRK